MDKDHRGNSRSLPIGWDASCTISVGLLTAKLDHFFMAEPYRFFLSCCTVLSVSVFRDIKPRRAWVVRGERGTISQILAVSASLTSNAIHDIGSSWGISVLFTSFSSSASSSNWTVKMAPGGVQVPIIKWWRGMLVVVKMVGLGRWAA